MAAGSSTNLILMCICINLLIAGAAQTVDLEERSTDISKEEMLRRAEESVGMGFVPPLLARQLYPSGSSITRPWTAAVKNLASSDPEEDGSPPREPKLTARRRAHGPGTGSASEHVYVATRFYGSTVGCEDLVATVRDAGFGALFPAATDPLLAHGKPLVLQHNSTDSPQNSAREEACGVGYVLAPRASVALSPSFLSPPSLCPSVFPSRLPPSTPQPTPSTNEESWWNNITLSDAAQVHLEGLSVLLREGQEERAQEAALAFFRRFGTHVLPGPIVWGGAAVAEAPKLQWKTNGEVHRRASEIRRRACHLRFALDALGTRVACGESEQPHIHESAEESTGATARNRCWRASLDAGEVPARILLVMGGTRRDDDDGGWLESVKWQAKPSETWDVIDRGPPLPIHLLVQVDRMRGVLIGTRHLLYREYLRLWQQANPNIVAHLARAKRVDVIQDLGRLLKLSIDVRDQEGLTALHHSVLVGDEDGVRALIQSGANIFLVSHHGSTALHLAAQRNESAIAFVLLQSGADPYAADGEGRTAAWYADAMGHAEVLDTIKGFLSGHGEPGAKRAGRDGRETMGSVGLQRERVA
jgi:hypothetical protein